MGVDTETEEHRNSLKPPSTSGGPDPCSQGSPCFSRLRGLSLGNEGCCILGNGREEDD